MISPAKCVLAPRTSPLTSLAATGHVAWTVTRYDDTTYQGTADAYCWHPTTGIKRITENASCSQLQLLEGLSGEVQLFCVQSGQVWQYNIQNCKGCQVTSFPLDIKYYYVYRNVDNEVYLLCCMDVDRDASVDDTTARDKTRPMTSGVLYGSLMVRQWTHWKVPGRFHHLFLCPLQTCDTNTSFFSADLSKLRDLFLGKAIDCPGKATHGSLSNFDVSPDGYMLAVSCRVHCQESGDCDPEAACNTRTAIYTIDLRSNAEPNPPELSQVTTDSASWSGYQSYPVFSPSGTRLALLSQATYQYESDRRVIRIYDIENRQLTPLTQDIDISFNGIQWESDTRLIATAIFCGNQRIFRLTLQYRDGAAEATRLEMLTGDTCRSSPVLAIVDKFPHLFFLESSIDHSSAVRSVNLTRSDIFVSCLPSKAMTLGPCSVSQLPHNCCNTVQLPHIILDNAPHQHYFSGAGGDRVHCWYVPPLNVNSNSSKKYPLLLLIHGGPQGNVMNQWHLRWNMSVFAAAGYGIVGVNFHGSAGFGKSFTDSIHGDWGGKPFEDCLLCVEYILSQYDYLDSDRVGAMGSSYGGYMINWINGHTKRFKCLVCHAGLFSLSTFYYTTEELWFPGELKIFYISNHFHMC